MGITCFICKSPYADAGDGFGEAAHFAFRHSLIVPAAYNDRNVTGEWVKAVARGADGDGVTYHARNMDFGEKIEPSTGDECCVEIGCNARPVRGHYCPMHSSESVARILR